MLVGDLFVFFLGWAVRTQTTSLGVPGKWKMYVLTFILSTRNFSLVFCSNYKNATSSELSEEFDLDIYFKRVRT